MVEKQKIFHQGRVTYNRDVDWLLNASGAAMGERSNFGSFESSMERGSVSAGGVPNTDLYNERQLGWGPDFVTGDVARKRDLEHVWRHLPRVAQVLLEACYTDLPKRFLGDNIAARVHGEWDSNENRLSGILVFWAWYRGELVKVDRWYAQAEPIRPTVADDDSLAAYKRSRAAYDAQKQLRATECPRYRKAITRLARLAHWHWRRAYIAHWPGLQELRAKHNTSEGAPLAL